MSPPCHFTVFPIKRILHSISIVSILNFKIRFTLYISKWKRQRKSSLASSAVELPLSPKCWIRWSLPVTCFYQKDFFLLLLLKQQTTLKEGYPPKSFFGRISFLKDLCFQKDLIKFIEIIFEKLWSRRIKVKELNKNKDLQCTTSEVWK